MSTYPIIRFLKTSTIIFIVFFVASCDYISEFIETEEVETEVDTEEVADDDESRVPYNRLYKLLSKGLGKSFTELYPTPDYFFDIASQLFK